VRVGIVVAMMLPPILTGCGGSGSRGDGPTTPSARLATTPTRDPGVSPLRVHDVTTGQHHTCGISTDGRIACWGGNDVGQIGDGTTEMRTRPVWIDDVEWAIDVDAGEWQTCALLEGGTALCWGGRPGLVRSVPRRLPEGPTGLRMLAVGRPICGLTFGGRASCWSWFHGTGDAPALRPDPLPQTDTAWMVDVGLDRACVLTEGQGAECFRLTERTEGSTGEGEGAGEPGEAEVGTSVGGDGDGGEGNETSGADVRIDRSPILVSLEGARQLAVSGDHACAVARGTVFCWGDNDHGQLGNGTRDSSEEPVEVPLAGVVTHVTTGWKHSCATTADGAVWCWGDNAHGQLGDGSTQATTRPTRVASLETAAVRIAAGRAHTCAVTVERDVLCWGLNDRGQLGTDNRESHLTPAPVADPVE